MEGKLINNSVYIVSADAKDLFLANYSNPQCADIGYSVKYSTGDLKGEFNTRKFINTLDYSLDLIKLREVYEKVYRNMAFTFNKRGKEYCRRVINVTFKYNVKEYNRFLDNTYIKFGYLPGDVNLVDNVDVRDEELIAIRLDSAVEDPIHSSYLGKYFAYEDGKYKLAESIKVIFTVADLRDRLYKDGFVCDGVHFRRFKRSSGSSRVGKCLFIDDRLYPRMHKWEMGGLRIKEGQEVDLAALEAYIALTLSSIIGTISLRPENFLLIDDFESTFTDKVIATRVGDDGWLKASPEEVEITNSIWDGQSLIDVSAMGAYASYGMILLRNRFFKSACFNANIQAFFVANNITSVSQLKGKTSATNIEDIKVITTPSSIKYLKFGSWEQWLEMLNDDSSFGVVKHEKPTHFFDGRMVQVHYQLLNTLQMSQSEVDSLVKPSLDYLKMIQSDPSVLRYHIKYSADSETISSVSTTNDVVYQMLGVSDKFANTKLYRDFKHDVTKSFKKTLSRGHILVDGNYSTLLGNPIEMLLESIGKFNGESHIGYGNIHCSRFEFGSTVLGSRSPHVTMGNILLAQNRESNSIDTYLNLTDEIVCINSIKENILMRLSGADFDSDTVLLTDNAILVGAASRNYSQFLVPTSIVHANKVTRRYTQSDQADLDIKTSVNKIGEIVNLSQELNTKLWHMLNGGVKFEEVIDLYCEISKLDVLSGIEIDKAKKEFSVDSVAEIRRLKTLYTERDSSGRQVKPNFFGKIARIKGYYDSVKKNYMFHNTTMDYLQHSLNSFRGDRASEKVVPFSDILLSDERFSKHSVKYPQVDRILDLARSMRSQIQKVWNSTDTGLDNASKAHIVAEIRDECYDYIKTIQLNRHTAYKLLLAIEDPKNKDISRSLFYMLFAVPNESFLSLLQQSKEEIRVLEETDSDEFDLSIYGFNFVKRSVNQP